MSANAKINNNFINDCNNKWYMIDEAKYNIQINTILTRSKTNYYKYDDNILISESFFEDSNKSFKVNIIQNLKGGIKSFISVVKN